MDAVSRRTGSALAGRRAALGLLLLGLLVASQGPGCGAYDHLTRSEGPVSPRPADCAGCHVEAAAEWERSAHARAWSSPHFAALTEGRTVEACLPCHAPAALHETGGEPVLRAANRAAGVDCQVCHLDHGALVGPVRGGALLEPHPVRVDRELYRSPELCGRCHAGTLAEYRAHASPGERTCQECHMPAVTRTVTQATGSASALLVAFEERVPQRRHLFDLRAVSWVGEAVASQVRAVRGEDGVAIELTLTNRLPHLVPTGDFGSRRALLRLVGRDAAGQETARLERRFQKELGQALVPGVASVTSGNFPVATRRLEVELVRIGREGPPLSLLRREIPLE